MVRASTIYPDQLPENGMFERTPFLLEGPIPKTRLLYLNLSFKDFSFLLLAWQTNLSLCFGLVTSTSVPAQFGSLDAELPLLLVLGFPLL